MGSDRRNAMKIVVIPRSRLRSKILISLFKLDAFFQ